MKVLSLLLLLALPEAAAAGRGELVSAHLRYRLTAKEAAAITGTAASAYPVEMYALVYRTLDGKGREVEASGAVAVPVGAPPGPVVSVQHGTVFEKNAVPSRLPPYRLWSGLAYAASGAIVVMPDYVGYGVSSASLHPYLHAESLAVSIVDFLRAARRFTERKKIQGNGELFLVGYSEGGYATLAAHREIEQRYSDEFTVTASAPIAGPYDLMITMEVLMRRGSSGSVPYLAFAFWAYDRIYGLNGLRGIFREPYRTRVERLFGRSPSVYELEGALPEHPRELFDPSFLREWSGEGAKQVKEEARANGLTEWKPAATVVFFHCTGDTVVPVENARVARDSFVSRGAGDIRLVERNLGDHGDCYLPLMAEAMRYFDSLRSRPRDQQNRTPP